MATVCSDLVTCPWLSRPTPKTFQCDQAITRATSSKTFPTFALFSLMSLPLSKTFTHDQHPESIATLPSNSPCNNFTQDRTNGFTTMASTNPLKRKKSMTTSCPSKRHLKKIPLGVTTSTLRENPGPAEATTSTTSKNFEPLQTTPLDLSENLTPAEAAPHAFGENPTPAEFTAPALNENGAPAESSRFVLSQNPSFSKVTSAGPRGNPKSAPTCSENPHFFSGQNFIDTLRSLADAPKATHSKTIRPCERGSAHLNKPHYVCLDCHNLAVDHINKTSPKLAKTNFLPICIECGRKALEQSTVGQSTAERHMSRCRCAAEWLCCQCQIESYELASAKNTAEQDLRRSLNAWWEGDGEDRKQFCNFKKMRCRCGRMIEKGMPLVSICVGCNKIA